MTSSKVLMQFKTRMNRYEALGSGVGKPGAGLAAPQARQGHGIFRYGQAKAKPR
jgi:hypothetical protein